MWVPWLKTCCDYELPQLVRRLPANLMWRMTQTNLIMLQLTHTSSHRHSNTEASADSPSPSPRFPTVEPIHTTGTPAEGGGAITELEGSETIRIQLCRLVLGEWTCGVNYNLAHGITPRLRISSRAGSNSLTSSACSAPSPRCSVSRTCWCPHLATVAISFGSYLSGYVSLKSFLRERFTCEVSSIDCDSGDLEAATSVCQVWFQCWVLRSGSCVTFGPSLFYLRLSWVGGEVFWCGGNRGLFTLLGRDAFAIQWVLKSTCKTFAIHG